MKPKRQSASVGEQRRRQQDREDETRRRRPEFSGSPMGLGDFIEDDYLTEEEVAEEMTEDR